MINNENPNETWIVSPISPRHDVKGPDDFPLSPVKEENARFDQKALEAPEVIEDSPKFLVVDSEHIENAPPQLAYSTSPALPVYPESPGRTSGDIESSAAAHEPTPSEGSTAVGELSSDSKHPQDKKRVCGLPPKRFYIILAIVLAVIIAAALGGGLGGGLSARNKSKAAAAVTPSPTASAAPVTVTSMVNPQVTGVIIKGYYLELYGDHGFEGGFRNISDQQGIFPISYTSGAAAPASTPTNGVPIRLMARASSASPSATPTPGPNKALSYIWVPRDTGCCVRFCLNNNSTGYRCQSETRQPEANVDKVVIKCGSAPDEETCAK